MLRTEPRNKNDDQAPTAILELVDGPRDIRFAMTAKTVARERALEGGIREITLRNIAKVTRFREGGEEALQKMVRAVETASGFEGNVEDERREIEKRRGSRVVDEEDDDNFEEERRPKKERGRNLIRGRPQSQ